MWLIRFDSFALLLQQTSAADPSNTYTSIAVTAATSTLFWKVYDAAIADASCAIWWGICLDGDLNSAMLYFSILLVLMQIGRDFYLSGDLEGATGAAMTKKNARNLC